MQSNLVKFPSVKTGDKSTQTKERAATKYDRAEQQFIRLLATEDLDNQLNAETIDANEFERTLFSAIRAAYQNGYGNKEAHRFLQRILYRINRLKLFWYDDLRNYTNERSL